jgi:hypothetical protein
MEWKREKERSVVKCFLHARTSFGTTRLRNIRATWKIHETHTLIRTGYKMVVRSIGRESSKWYPTRSSATFLVTGDSPDTSSTLLSVRSINSFKLAWLLARLFPRRLCFGFLYQFEDFLSSSTEHDFTIECHPNDCSAVLSIRRFVRIASQPQRHRHLFDRKNVRLV